MDYRKDQPSVKLHHAPGGQSNFSLAWDDGSSGAAKKPSSQITSPFATHEEAKAAPTTSVKVHQAPGGASNFSLSDGSQGATVSSVKLHHAPGGQTQINFSDGSNTSQYQTSNQAASAQIGGVPKTQQAAAGQATGGARKQPPGGISQITF
jgi:hypothetical protein